MTPASGEAAAGTPAAAAGSGAGSAARTRRQLRRARRAPRPSGDAVSALTVYAVLLFLVPSNLVFGPLGAAASKVIVGGIPDKEANASLRRLREILEVSAG